MDIIEIPIQASDALVFNSNLRKQLGIKDYAKKLADFYQIKIIPSNKPPKLFVKNANGTFAEMDFKTFIENTLPRNE